MYYNIRRYIQIETVGIRYTYSFTLQVYNGVFSDTVYIMFLFDSILLLVYKVIHCLSR